MWNSVAVVCIPERRRRAKLRPRLFLPTQTAYVAIMCACNPRWIMVCVWVGGGEMGDFLSFELVDIFAWLKGACLLTVVKF